MDSFKKNIHLTKIFKKANIQVLTIHFAINQLSRIWVN